MGSEILYLDGNRDKAVEKAIKRYGNIYYAKDVNEAVELIADRKFDYYFLDADIPYVRELLVHLDHDPYFIPPKAFVLLTDNEVEDCEAWKVDTFITRRRIKEDLPFVFSHLVGGPPDDTGVLKLITERNENDKEFRNSSVISDDLECSEDYENCDLLKESEHSFNRGEKIQENAGGLKSFMDRGSASRGKGEKKFSAKLTTRRRPLRLVSISMLAIMLTILIYALVPTGSGNAKKSSANKAGKKTSVTETGKTKYSEDKRTDDFIYTSEEINQKQEAGNVSQPPGDNADGDSAAPVTDSVIQTTEITDAPSNTYSSPPPIAPANNPPSVSISGPTQVYARQSATYRASASDSEGDSISYSWGSSSKTMSWSTPGQYTVTVTVTDSKGASRSASISVRVI